MRYQLSLDRPEPTVVDSDKKAEDLLQVLRTHDVISLDTETTGLDIAKDVVVYWSVAVDLKARYFLMRKHLPTFQEIWDDPTKSWVGSQIKYDANIMANTGYPIHGDYFCTLTMDRLVDPGRDHGLKDAYEREFGERMRSFKETFYPKDAKGIPRKPAKKEMYQILTERYETDPERVEDYASMDAWATLRLFYRLKQHLKKMITWAGYNLWGVFLWLEVPLTKVLYEDEREGMPLDVEYLNNCRPAIVDEMQKLEEEMYKQAGRMINLRSPTQLAAYIYEELGYKPLEKTRTGRNKLDKVAYDYLINEGCLAAAIVQKHAKLSKMKSTYIDGLIERLDRYNKLHTTLNQHVAETGRLSSSDPNLQNQIKDGGEVLNIRQAFIAPRGFVLIVGDYDQLELYIAAHYSGDKALLDAINLHRDLHCANVEMVFEEPYDEVYDAKQRKEEKEALNDRHKYLLELRYAIKAICFGILYGKAAGSLSIDLRYPALVEEKYPRWDKKKVAKFAREMAQEKIDLFFERSPGVRKFVYRSIRDAYEVGYVETVIGRRRTLHNFIPWDVMQDHKLSAQEKGLDLCWCRACVGSRSDERKAINSRIQGSAADITALAMIGIDQDERLRQLLYRQTLQVHDEIVGQSPIPNKEEATERVQWHMEHPTIKLNVPLRSAPHWASSWSEAKG